MDYTICPSCKKMVVVRSDGRIAWHYPEYTGPACPSSLKREGGQGMKNCDCWLYPAMHDKSRVCVNWDLHDGACDSFHSQKKEVKK